MDSEKQEQNLYPPVYQNAAPSFQDQPAVPYPTQNQAPYPTQNLYPPQYEAMNPQPGVVITTQPTAATTVIVQNMQVGPNPQAVTCPNCRALVTTSVKSEPVAKTHVIAGIICLCGCWLGCCLIPYCVDSCQGQRHTCPNCNNFIGMHK